jgi:hypothetical protein
MPTLVARVVPLGFALLATGAAACSGSHSGASSTHGAGTANGPGSAPAASTTTAPSTTAPPTTAAYQPTSPQPSPDDAASQLVQDWGNGDRAGAAAVAAPTAVTSLFAVPYPGSSLDFRGCSGTFSPAVCSYRDGSSFDSPLIQLTTTQLPAGWYVSSAMVES